MATIPMVDYVTADKRGPVPEADKAPSKRWDKSVAQKPGPLHRLARSRRRRRLPGRVRQRAGAPSWARRPQGGIKFYSLDNEPALWPSTHPRVHPDKTTYAEMVSRTEATASGLLKVDPTAFVLGAVAYGWAEYKTLQEAPDSKEHNDKYGTYLDYFLASMKKLEEKHHQRLVHALDVHWYPEARGAKRITEPDNSPKTDRRRACRRRAACGIRPTSRRAGSPASSASKPIRLIPWLQEKIADRYPGTKLAMTEYDFGARDPHLGRAGAGGRARHPRARGCLPGELLGQRPRQRPAAELHQGRLSDLTGTTTARAARSATRPSRRRPADQDKASVFAATDSKHPGTLTVLVLNKQQHTVFNGKIAIKGGAYSKAKVFAFDGTSPKIQSLPDAQITNNQLSYRLPPMSATLFVCTGR